MGKKETATLLSMKPTTNKFSGKPAFRLDISTSRGNLAKTIDITSGTTTQYARLVDMLGGDFSDVKGSTIHVELVEKDNDWVDVSI